MLPARQPGEDSRGQAKTLRVYLYTASVKKASAAKQVLTFRPVRLAGARPAELRGVAIPGVDRAQYAAAAAVEHARVDHGGRHTIFVPEQAAGLGDAERPVRDPLLSCEGWLCSGIERAHDAAAAAVEYVRVDHGGGDVLVPEQLLHRPNVVAGFEQMRRKRVPERVRRRMLGDSGHAYRLLHGTLDRLRIGMMAAFDARARIDRAHGRGENVLPCPLAPGVRVFPGERVGQENLAALVPKISLVERTDAHEMLAERQDKGAGKNRHAIAEALALAAGVSTTGRRRGCLALSTRSSHGSSTPRTSL